jgi:hypothetical protein
MIMGQSAKYSHRVTFWAVLLGAVTVLGLLNSCIHAADTPEEKDNAKKVQDKGPKAPIPIRVDRKKRIVDIDAVICLREGDWLELLACAKGTKEHESILSIKASPSEVHGALLLIGLKEGSPLRYVKVGGKRKLLDPQGPRIAITLVYKDEKGKTIEIPAHEWVVNQKSGKKLNDNIWLFSGSFFDKYKVPKKLGSDEYVVKERYAADLSGTIISLVNFGDDVLSRDTNLTDKTDGGVWGVATKKVPKLGTKVIIRMRPAAKVKPDTKKGKSDDSKSSKSKK